MNRVTFVLLLVVCFMQARSQVQVVPVAADSIRLVDLSNLQQDGHTMIALTFGQSNAANNGQVAYTAHHTSVLNYYKGKLYTAKDPLFGATGTGGSVWSHLGDMLVDSGVYDKVIFVPIAVGGSAIGRWTNGDCAGRLQEALNYLDSQHIKLTHIFWHQGETDNLLNTTETTYKKSLDTIINIIRLHRQNAPVYISIASYHPFAVAKQLGVDPVIRNAQIDFINEHKNVLLGPDTDKLIYAIDRCDGVHFSDFGMKRFAQLWFSAIKEKKESVKTSQGALAGRN